MTLTLRIQVASAFPELPSRARFKRWVETALRFLPAERTVDSVELGIRLVDEAESAVLNTSYRHKNGPTNVLSFPAEAPPGVAWSYVGDIVICAPLVVQEATQQHKPPLAHWAHLTVHGVLHVYGYDHECAEDAAVMEALEVEILASLGFANPY